MSGTNPSGSRAALLELRAVELTYGGASPVHAIAGIDLLVPRNEYLAIMGVSGSGKSSLLNILKLLCQGVGLIFM